MNYYVRLILVILVVMAAAEFIPEAVNAFLALVLAGMVIMNSRQFAALVKKLKL